MQLTGVLFILILVKLTKLLKHLAFFLFNKIALIPISLELAACMMCKYLLLMGPHQIESFLQKKSYKHIALKR